MIFCPRCLKKFNKDRYEVSDGFICPNCRQQFNNATAICGILFPDCITKIRYVGLNSWEDAKEILKMMS
jgi:uncharacterized CHY-type Zn-finger protein